MARLWKSGWRKPAQWALCCAVAAVAAFGTGRAIASEPEAARLLDLSPEDLGRLQVTSVSRKLEALSGAPASVYVITAEDIRRSTATTIAEVLRLAPTLQVAQDNGIPAFISARGHTSGVYAFSQKLLVLVDGRSVYSTFFSGVLWDAQDLVLEDIERIEVISGPAGVMWGVNAVNGVINIITRSSEATQGLLASANAGDRARDGALRYGGKFGEDGSYRIYGKVLNRRENSREIDGQPLADHWRSTLAGGRADWRRGADKLTLQFNTNSVNEGQPEPGAINVQASAPLPDIQARNFNVVGRWVRADGDGGTTAVQAYIDHNYRTLQPAISYIDNALDLELHRNMAARGKHSLSFGANLRYSRLAVDNSLDYGILPPVRNQYWMSFFAQDDIALSERWRLLAGARVERGPFATVDLLPSVRLAWQAERSQMLWGGVSRGARGPSPFDAAFRWPSVGAARFEGNPNMKSEIVDVVELGYRYQASKGSFSATVFRNWYDRLAAVVGPPYTADNAAKGQANGLELWGDYRLTPWWRLAGGLTLLSESYDDRSGVTTTGVRMIAGSSPGQTAQLRSAWDLGRGKELDLILRHVSELNLFGPAQVAAPVPSYNAIDLRFGWKLGKQLEFSIFGQNLLGTRHAEYGYPDERGVMTQRIFTKLTWRQ